MMFVVVNADDDEEGSMDDEGEDGLDLSNMFDEIPQDTDDIIETIETIDALEQDLFPPLTPSPVATQQQPQDSTEKQSDIPTKKPSEMASKEPIGTPTPTPTPISVNQESSEDSDVPVVKYKVMKSQAKIVLFLVYVLSQVVYVNFT